MKIGSVVMFDEKTLTQSQEAEKRWRAVFHQMQERMKSEGRTPQTHSGLPIKNAYFPHDIEHLEFAQIGTPGSYPFTRGNLAAQHQLMSWPNQPVIAEGSLSAALEEDVDVIGISSSSGGQMPVFEDLLAGMRKQELDDVLR